MLREQRPRLSGRLPGVPSGRRSTTATIGTGTFVAPLATWREFAHTNRSEGAVLLADAVTDALNALPPRRDDERPIVLTITRHDEEGSHYTVTAVRGRRRKATRQAPTMPWQPVDNPGIR